MSRDLLPVKRFRFLDGQLATGDNGNNSSSDESYHTAVEEEDSEHGVVEESRAKRRKRKQARSGRTNSDAPDRFLASALEKRTPQGDGMDKEILEKILKWYHSENEASTEPSHGGSKSQGVGERGPTPGQAAAAPASPPPPAASSAESSRLLGPPHQMLSMVQSMQKLVQLAEELDAAEEKGRAKVQALFWKNDPVSQAKLQTYMQARIRTLTALNEDLEEPPARPSASDE